MCRLLLVKSLIEFPISEHLKEFAIISKNCSEYQGHGWGCAYITNDSWKIYKNIKPIWEDNIEQFGKTTLLIAHARSAFRNEGIQIENNMPFQKDDKIFIFNGELRGVRIKEQGRIGAEKIFNFILRFHNRNLIEAFKKALDIIEKKSNYVKAMNIIMSDKKNIYLASIFNEDTKYFTMHRKKLSNGLIICSEPYPKDLGWEKINNNMVKEIQI
jgi:glutamine amidotransferase